ncbi:Gfo/Idh/MocA family oxidoreductase [Bacillus sp. HSf4]|uniref:Gfo/Idh/MocA family protein n=1 Tax=Bacillus sp. HSf4 TaxID=3035514 RepID=UPI00240976E9|nr:Gfo/Idh/MocA family oxidoreductase [Bacillus sp. HSf4]WFA05709.1 Gfo/Idh/MocA family oxidoreductase [Bacillus sp. HSf4]
MKHRTINTGIIGGSMNNQWASRTHIPVLKDSPHFRITAIGTSNIDTANKSAAAINAPLAFTVHRALAAAKEVDLVVVSVKVPFHYEAAIAAIAAHKHIYCEWPLGVSTQQAKELADSAEQANIHHAVGLQARQSPEIKYMKQAINKGEIGRVLSCTMHVATQGKGGTADLKNSYLLEKENGADLLAINGGHSLDALCYILGDFKELSSIMNMNYAEAVLQETGEKTRKNTADQIVINGTLTNGASASIHIEGGVLPAFRLEIQGEKGAFRLTQERSLGHVQFGRLKLEKAEHIGGAEDIHWKEISRSSDKDMNPAGYVDRAYHVLAKDILANTWDIPDFHDAVKLHELLDAVRKSAETGKKVILHH